MKNQRLFFEQ